MADSVGLFGEPASTSWDYIELMVLVHHEIWKDKNEAESV